MPIHATRPAQNPPTREWLSLQQAATIYGIRPSFVLAPGRSLSVRGASVAPDGRCRRVGGAADDWPGSVDGHALDTGVDEPEEMFAVLDETGALDLTASRGALHQEGRIWSEAPVLSRWLAPAKKPVEAVDVGRANTLRVIGKPRKHCLSRCRAPLPSGLLMLAKDRSGVSVVGTRQDQRHVSGQRQSHLCARANARSHRD